MHLLHRLPLVFVWVLFSLSLALVGFSTRSEEQWHGYQILAYGALSIIYGTVAWLANLCLVVATLLWNRPRAPIVLSIGGLALALSSYTFSGTPAGDNGYDPVATWGLGFRLWLAAFAVLIVAAILRSNISLERTRER